MKRTVLTLSLILATLIGYAQTKITGIKKVADGLYVMYYDSTQQKKIITKSLVVEFKNYTALLEMPISNGGGGETHLTDHTEGGEAVLQALHKYFPHKPLKYVLCTHWHSHSISSIKPFISKGITVITTENNFKRLSEFVDSATYSKYKKYIVFVGDDGMTIKDKSKSNSIVIYKLNKADYPHIPTEDFLFFYIPKNNCLHNSCMYQRFATSRVCGKELISSRVEDLDKFVTLHHLNPDYLVTTDTYWDEPMGVVAGDTLRKMMQTGITMGALEKQVLSFDETTMVTQSDSVLKYLMDNRIPYSILNSAVYTALKQNKLHKALAIARLLALINPSDPNVWDTYGEVYYFMGETKMAKKYEYQSKQIDSSFTWGGEGAWKHDLETFSKNWDK